MIWKPVPLDLSTEQIRNLKAHNAKVLQYLEEGRPLQPNVWQDLKNELSHVVAQTKDLTNVLHKINHSGDYYAVQLLHSDNEILNLPWTMAIDPHSNKQLADLQQLFVAKCLPDYARQDGQDVLPKAAPPLKILIMISSPQDADHRNRLSYEDEEFQVLSAFEPLLQTGQVEIDFTDDGSLEALQRKLKKNNYHVLHFSGHGIFKNDKGYLQLENPLNLRTELVSAEDFANALNCNPDYRVPVVMLSSCQTAQGNTEADLRGVTNHLLKVGVPAVIAMGMSIKDHYAAFFSAQFYRQIADKQNILSAFQSAMQQLRQREYDDLVKARVPQPTPLQWLIPNLYFNANIDHLVNWSASQEELQLSSYRFISEHNRLLLRHDEKYTFIGRRLEKAQILAPLFERKPVLLKGQGGVGKTAMAEYCVQRLIVANPRTQPFLFNETVKSIQDIVDTLQKYVIEKGNIGVIVDLKKFDKGIEKFQHLVNAVAKYCQPVFVFDNLETFQTAPGDKFAEKHQDLAEAIAFLCNCGLYHLLLTCRYPLVDFANVQSFDLNQVALTDFWKKCHDLTLFRLQKDLYKKEQAAVQHKEQIKFIDIVKLLHQTFGGNYRALEFYDTLFRENPTPLPETREKLEQMRANVEADKVLEHMRSNLILPQLLALLTDEQQSVLQLISHFRIPVQEFALKLQLPSTSVWAGGRRGIVDLADTLQKLNDLTLIEISLDQQILQAYYYATPIVKDLLADAQPGMAALPFSSQQAGAYHYHSYQNIEPSLTELEEAFYHFYQAETRERVQAIGEDLSRIYYNYSLYQNTFYYAQQTYRMLRDETNAKLLNRFGQIHHIYGQYDDALLFFKKASTGYKRLGDKSGEGATLNNISQIYDARGDYETALSYLESSLKIRQEIGDKSGEGATLNNISQIFQARGDYETALSYLEEVLKIIRELGDKQREGVTLNNISLIFQARGDYETALSYLESSLKIRQEIGDKSGEGTTLNNISQIFQARGDYETALSYLESSLKIRQEIGDKSGEGTTLNNISQIFQARGDYETALSYLESSLKIRQEIGDKSGEGTTLNNISQIFQARGDYETALSYLESSLKIRQEIGDKSGEGTTLNNISQIFQARGDYETALSYLESSLKIRQEIGDKSGEAYRLFNLAMAYRDEKVNRPKKAMEYLKEVVAINATLKNAELTKALQQLGMGQ